MPKWQKLMFLWHHERLLLRKLPCHWIEDQRSNLIILQSWGGVFNAPNDNYKRQGKKFDQRTDLIGFSCKLIFYYKTILFLNALSKELDLKGLHMREKPCHSLKEPCVENHCEIKMLAVVIKFLMKRSNVRSFWSQFSFEKNTFWKANIFFLFAVFR